MSDISNKNESVELVQELLTSVPSKRGKNRVLESDGLIVERTAPSFPIYSTVLYEGARWTVVGFNPDTNKYAIRNNELMTTVPSIKLTQING